MKRHKQKKPGRREAGLEVLQPAGLLEFLLASLKDKSRNKIKLLLLHRQVLVDGKIITQFDHALAAGQRVSFGQATPAEKSPGYGVKIVFEDSCLIVIDKPHGLLSIATATEKHKTAFHVLSRYVKQQSAPNKIFIVHRLDREASGLMLFAKDQATKDTLQNDWRNIVYERKYAALVEGNVPKDEGTITSWIKENEAMTMYTVPDGGEAKQAITHYRVLKRAPGYTLLEVELETGRKNQIRIHMQELGHSISGDKKYGAKNNPIKRLGLHAYKLGFMHPVTKENLSFTSPTPGSFLRLFPGNY